MRIVHITSELAPIAKVGGLGDVIQGLSKAIVRAGEEVEIILPFYNHIDKKALENLKVEQERLISYGEMGECANRVFSARVDGLKVFLIEPYHPHCHAHKYFKRGKIYGEKDDIHRFIYFSRAALEYLLQKGKRVDVLHLHDWLTALCAPLYLELYVLLGLKVGTIVTTIHNMYYQGVCQPKALEQIGFQTASLMTQDKMQDHKKPNCLNLLKGGIAYSDVITTVSPTYAEEIKKNQGHGLAPFLRQHKHKLRGILNGIDTECWNPETDPYLIKNYSPRSSAIQEVLEGKQINKRALYKKLSQKESKAPLFACITRLVKQKGPELICFGIEHILKKGGQCILLASTLQEGLDPQFQQLKKRYRDHPHLHLHFEFDQPLAHLLFAGADCLLMPSLFEPCGLTQMIALRYGTIPIVHRVGGLKDTIFDIDEKTSPEEKKNGYTFDTPSSDSFGLAIDRAFEDFSNNRKKWLLMMERGLNQDLSWGLSALQYLLLYRKQKMS